MNPLFKSSENQLKFEQDGFVKIPLLNEAEVADLLTAYKQVAEEHERINIPYITTSLTFNPELIEHVDKVLQKVMGPAIDRFMINYKLLFGNYLVKMPVEHSETEPHQDITFVDEDNYASVNIWVGLQDTTTENGCMYFLKGSHTLVPTLRPANRYDWEYENVKAEIIQGADTFPAKAGEAFIFNHAVLHGSYPNNSGQPRVAAVIAAYSSDAQLIHYHLPFQKQAVLQKYSMTKEAFLTLKDGQPPANGVFLGEVDHSFKQISKKEFKELVGEKAGKKTLFNSIVNMFKA